MDIRAMLPDDWEQVSRIYAEGIATGNATFEQAPPTWESWDSDHLRQCRLVAEEDGEILGWAALSPVSSRCIYAGVAESSIYVSAKSRGKGVGASLLNTLVSESEKNGFWMLQAGVFPENKASTKLHEKCGFRMVGIRERVGKMNGVWRDNQLLERRSKIVGVD